jgi:hypothetical protein
MYNPDNWQLTELDDLVNQTNERSLGARKSKGLNMIAKVNKGHLREKTLGFNNNYSHMILSGYVI